MTTFAEASKFFANNPDLLIEFVLKDLKNPYKLRLYSSLREYLSNRFLLPRESFDSNETYGKIPRLLIALYWLLQVK